MSLWATLVSEALQTVWPAGCAACDRTIPEQALFCGACNLSINPMVGACAGCALPLGGGAAERCPTCRRVPFPFAGATSGFEYGEALAEAVVRMKHGGRRDLARRLARLLVHPLAETLSRGEFDGGDLVVPVPLHPARLRARGFNQAHELARWALAGLSAARAVSSPWRKSDRAETGAAGPDARSSGAPNTGGIQASSDAADGPAPPVSATRRLSPPAVRPGAPLPRLDGALLRRIRLTRELGHAGPAARLAEVAGAFGVGDADRARGRRVLVIDDVFTTGATFSACADALLAAGARAVHVLALARAV